MKKKNIRRWANIAVMILTAAIIFAEGCHKSNPNPVNLKEENIKNTSMQADPKDPKDMKGTMELSGTIENGQRVVQITARKFEFIPNVIVVKKGESIKLEITSKDVTHGFKIEKYNIERRLEPNKTEVISFIADKAGKFNFHCTVFCGVGHLGMKGKLIVVE
jgi:cytochrome c oxidase subunit II